MEQILQGVLKGSLVPLFVEYNYFPNCNLNIVKLLAIVILIFLFQWEAFEFPELRNFLVFLNREEEDMISQVKANFLFLRLVHAIRF